MIIGVRFGAFGGLHHDKAEWVIGPSSISRNLAHAIGKKRLACSIDQPPLFPPVVPAIDCAPRVPSWPPLVKITPAALGTHVGGSVG